MFDLDQLFQKSELIPVIIQHARTKDVLMLGFTNREAVERTLQTKTAWFWSRSRGKLWNKGETSGHFLHGEQIFTDCDTGHPALLLPARRPYLSHRTRQLLFSGDYVMIPIVPLGS